MVKSAVHLNYEVWVNFCRLGATNDFREAVRWAEEAPSLSVEWAKAGRIVVCDMSAGKSLRVRWNLEMLEHRTWIPGVMQ